MYITGLYEESVKKIQYNTIIPLEQICNIAIAEENGERKLVVNDEKYCPNFFKKKDSEDIYDILVFAVCMALCMKYPRAASVQPGNLASKIVNKIVCQFKVDHKIDLTHNSAAMQRVIAAAKKAEQELAHQPATKIYIPAIISYNTNSIDIKYKIRRDLL